MAQKLILNRYRVLGELGSGGFASVQLVWDTVMQRKVALKCIELSEFEAMRVRSLEPASGVDSTSVREHGSAPASAEEEVALPWNDVPDADASRADVPVDSAAFELERTLANIPGLDEARAVATFNDSAIVAVYDFQVEGTTAYLSMEYVEGMSLSQLLREQGDALTLDVVTAVFEAVAHALEVAHDNGVLHLDIKPDNVLIDRKGQVKVTDFGLARMADANGFGVAGGGTIGYMPLEQMRQEDLDERCDEWALAALTYEMLAGENPFLAPDLARAEAAIEDAELVLPSLCWGDELEEGVDDVLFFALDPDRAERYDTVAEFAEEMDPYLADAKRGKKELAAIASRKGEGDEAAEPMPREPREPRTPLMERIGDRAASVIARVWAVAAAVLVALVMAANLPFVHGWDSPVLWASVVVCAAAAGIKPHVGAVVSYAFAGAALVLCDAPLAGVLLIAATGAWWWFVGRGGNRPAAAALAFPLCGAVGLGPLAAVMCGAFLKVPQAALTALYAAFVAVLFTCVGGNGAMLWGGQGALGFWDVAGALPNPFGAGRFLGFQTFGVPSGLGDFGLWATVASWVAAAAVFAAFCVRGTRVFDVLGAVAACAVLALGAFGGAALMVEPLLWPDGAMPLAAAFAQYLPGALLAGVVGIVAAAMGVPDRVRWDDPLKE